jgi:hypothetical protein
LVKIRIVNIYIKIKIAKAVLNIHRFFEAKRNGISTKSKINAQKASNTFLGALGFSEKRKLAKAILSHGNAEINEKIQHKMIVNPRNGNFRFGLNASCVIPIFYHISFGLSISLLN